MLLKRLLRKLLSVFFVCRPPELSLKPTSRLLQDRLQRKQQQPSCRECLPPLLSKRLLSSVALRLLWLLVQTTCIKMQCSVPRFRKSTTSTKQVSLLSSGWSLVACLVLSATCVLVPLACFLLRLSRPLRRVPSL